MKAKLTAKRCATDNPVCRQDLADRMVCRTRFAWWRTFLERLLGKPPRKRRRAVVLLR